MKRTLSLLMLGAAVVVTAGCGTIHHNATFPQNKPIAFGPNLGEGNTYALVHPFEETDRQVYFFYHWFPINHANGVEAAEKHLSEGDGIVNLRIRTEFSPVDYVLTLLTGGLFSTYTIHTYGDIVRLPAPPPRL